jgi:predicted dehydrogenase
MVTWTLDYCNSYQNGWSLEFQGHAGTLQLEATGFRVYREPWAQSENREPAIQVSGSLPVEPHVENFLECIRSRREPNAPIEVGAAAVSGPHLANIAFLQQRRAASE